MNRQIMRQIIKMDKLTKKQAAIITASTGVLVGSISNFHEYAEKICGHAIYTHELYLESMLNYLKERSRNDFLAIQPEGNDES